LPLAQEPERFLNRFRSKPEFSGARLLFYLDWLSCSDGVDANEVVEVVNARGDSELLLKVID